ncbi:hypothetical protein GQ457_01G008870 [Hibiscus cannabinus]
MVDRKKYLYLTGLLPIPRNSIERIFWSVRRRFKLRRKSARALGFTSIPPCLVAQLAKVLVTPPTVHLPSLVPLDPFGPVSPSLHDPRLLLIVTRISSSVSDCSDILRSFGIGRARTDFGGSTLSYSSSFCMCLSSILFFCYW